MRFDDFVEPGNELGRRRREFYFAEDLAVRVQHKERWNGANLVSIR